MKWCLCLIVFFPSLNYFCQYQELSDADFIEILLDGVEDENNYYVELLTDLMDNPIDITQVTGDQINSLLLLDTKEKNEIKNKLYLVRESNDIDEFVEKLELEDLKKELIRRIFVIGKPDNRISINLRTFAKIDSKKEVVNNSKIKHYTNSSINWGNKYFLKVITDKDKYEKNIFDFWGLSLSIQNMFGNNIIIGDYSIHFALGLSEWGPYRINKSSNAVSGISNVKFTPGFVSSSENKNKRGLYLERKIFGLNFSGFYYNNRIDATLSDSTFNFYNSGYHRTETEIEKVDQVQEQGYGVIIYYNKNKFYSAILFENLSYDYWLSNSFTRSPINNISSISFSSGIEYKQLEYNGEFSHVRSGNALTQTVKFNISKKIKLISLFRYIPSQYYFPHMNSFTEFNTNNEIGNYIGLSIKTPLGRIESYYDIFKQVTNSEIKLPDSGHELMIYFLSNTFQRIKIGFKYNFRKNEKYKILKEIYKTHRFRLTINYSPVKSIRIKSRFEYLIQGNNYENNLNGYYGYLSLIFGKVEDLIIKFRTTYFNTNTSIGLYSYEDDIYGGFSIPRLSGKGIRFYLLLNKKIGNLGSIEMKYVRHSPIDSIFPDFSEFTFQVRILLN